MPAVRNVATRDLDVGGRVFVAGETVEVPANLVAELLTNPNFEAVAAAPVTETAKPRKKD